MLVLNFQIVLSREPNGSVFPNQDFVLKQILTGIVFSDSETNAGTAPVLKRLNFSFGPS